MMFHEYYVEPLRNVNVHKQSNDLFGYFLTDLSLLQ